MACDDVQRGFFAGWDIDVFSQYAISISVDREGSHYVFVDGHVVKGTGSSFVIVARNLPARQEAFGGYFDLG